jgi:hypothetical protein
MKRAPANRELGQRRREFQALGDVGNVGSAALSGCLFGDGLPALPSVGGRLDHAELAEHGHDARHPELSGLLHDEIHALAPRQRLQQGDGAHGTRHLEALAEGDFDGRLAHGRDACLNDSAGAVEDLNRCPWREPQHLDEVAVGGFINGGSLALQFLRGNVDADHTRS